MATDPLSRTDQYEKLAKEKDPLWFTIRQQFTLTSLLTVLGVLGAWVATFLYQNTRIVILETKVVIVEKVSGLAERVSNLEGRVVSVEKDLDYARTWHPEPGTQSTPVAPAPRAPAKHRAPLEGGR